MNQPGACCTAPFQDIVRPESAPAGNANYLVGPVYSAKDFFRVVEQLPYRADAGSPGLHDMYAESPRSTP